MRTRFNKFINLPELIHLFKEVADIILPDMLDIKRPELKDGKYKVVVSEASDYVKERIMYCLFSRVVLRNCMITDDFVFSKGRVIITF